MDKLRASTRIAAAAALVAIASLRTFAQPATGGSAPPTGPKLGVGNRIEARAVNLRNSRGSLRCVLFNSPDGFPRDDSKAVSGVVAKVVDRRAACVFARVPPGSYAIAVLHDENDNKKMDYNFIGIPLEGYGFSNDPRVMLSPPSFDAAKFEYRGARLLVPIKLHYMAGGSSKDK